MIWGSPARAARRVVPKPLAARAVLPNDPPEGETTNLWLIKVGAAHEVVAARTAELAFLIVQLVAATWTPTPMFAFGSAIERDSAFGGVNRLVVGGGLHWRKRNQ